MHKRIHSVRCRLISCCCNYISCINTEATGALWGMAWYGLENKSPKCVCVCVCMCVYVRAPLPSSYCWHQHTLHENISILLRHHIRQGTLWSKDWPLTSGLISISVGRALRANAVTCGRPPRDLTACTQHINYRRSQCHGVHGVIMPHYVTILTAEVSSMITWPDWRSRAPFV